MLINFPKFLKNYSTDHKDALNLIISDAPSRYITSLVYAIFPIIIAGIYNEWIAGIIFGALNLFFALVLNPIIGVFSDIYGSKQILLLNKVMMILCGILWLIFPMNNLYIILLFMTLLLLHYAFRINETYLLRITNKNEGGLIFGIAENIYSISYFLATLSIAFFSLTENYHIAAYLMIIFGISSLLSLKFIKNDLQHINLKRTKKLKFIQLLNPINSIKSALHFIKVNNNYPLITCFACLFQGLFYGAIWFIFPLHLSELGTGSIEGGLQLGIYELVTILFAGISGYLADKYNWKHIHSTGWLLVLIGVCLMPFYTLSLGLILIGLVIGIGNNLFYFAAEHALEEYDIDHQEDGEFMAVNKMIGDISYGIGPVIVGFLYFNYGFQTSLLFPSIISGIIAIGMIWFTYRK